MSLEGAFVLHNFVLNIDTETNRILFARLRANHGIENESVIATRAKNCQRTGRDHIASCLFGLTE